jgi:hypothetical protein
MSEPVPTLVNQARERIKTLCLPSRLELPTVMLAERLAHAPSLRTLLAIMVEGDRWVESLVNSRRDITGAEGHFLLEVLEGVADQRQDAGWPA